MSRARRTRLDHQITNALILIFALAAAISFFALIAVGQESGNELGILPIAQQTVADQPVVETSIGGPEVVDAGSGLFWLSVHGQPDAENVTWSPIVPRGIQPAWMTDAGLSLGVVAPNWCRDGYVAAPGADEHYNRLRELEIQLIDWEKRVVLTHVVKVEGENPPPIPGPEPEPEPPPVPEKILTWIIYEAEDERWGDVEVDFRDAANPFEGRLRIIKKGSASEIDQGYERIAKTEYGPVLILDDDTDPSVVIHNARAPTAPNHPDGTRAEIEKVITSYLQQPTPAKLTPIPEVDYQPRGTEQMQPLTEDGAIAASEASEVNGRDDYVDAAEPGFVHPKDDPTDLIPVVEREGKKVFCVGDRCFDY